MENKSAAFDFDINEIHRDENGNPLNGTRISEDKKIIYRFRNGMLDGDIFSESGKFLMQKPAIETSGHIEYRRKNLLHRENGLPAVSAKGFAKREYWINGIRQPDKEE